MTKDAQETRFKRKDVLLIGTNILLTILFTLRKGPMETVIWDMAKRLWAYGIYSLATVLIIIGLTKKMFKYEPTKVQIVRWAAMFAAFAAISQFLHEAVTTIIKGASP